MVASLAMPGFAMENKPPTCMSSRRAAVGIACDMRSDGNKPSANAAMIAFKYTDDSSGHDWPSNGHLLNIPLPSFRASRVLGGYEKFGEDPSPHVVD